MSKVFNIVVKGNDKPILFKTINDVNSEGKIELIKKVSTIEEDVFFDIINNYQTKTIIIKTKMSFDTLGINDINIDLELVKIGNVSETSFDALLSGNINIQGHIVDILLLCAVTKVNSTYNAVLSSIY